MPSPRRLKFQFFVFHYLTPNFFYSFLDLTFVGNSFRSLWFLVRLKIPEAITAIENHHRQPYDHQLNTTCGWCWGCCPITVVACFWLVYLPNASLILFVIKYKKSNVIKSQITEIINLSKAFQQRCKYDNFINDKAYGCMHLNYYIEDETMKLFVIRKLTFKWKCLYKYLIHLAMHGVID